MTDQPDRLVEVFAVLAACVQRCPDCRRLRTEPAPLISHVLCGITVEQARALLEQALRLHRRRT